MVFLGFFMESRGCIYPIFVVQLVCGKGSRPGKRQVEVALRRANNAASAKKLLLQRRKSVFLTCRVFCLRKIQQTISDRTAAPQIKKNADVNADKGVNMLIDSNQMVSMTEANQNFSKVVRQAEDNGCVVIMKNNKPKFVLIDVEAMHPALSMSDERIDRAAKKEISRAKWL